MRDKKIKLVFFPEHLFCYFSVLSCEFLLSATFPPGTAGNDFSGRQMGEPSPKGCLLMPGAGKVRGECPDGHGGEMLREEAALEQNFCGRVGFDWCSGRRTTTDGNSCLCLGMERSAERPQNRWGNAGVGEAG